MKDPTRWRDRSAGGDPQVRALLLNDRAPLPSSAEVDRIWSGLTGGLNIAPVPTAAPQAGQVAVAAAAGKGALAAKLTLAIVLVAGAGASIGWHSLSSHNPREAETQRESHQDEAVRGFATRRQDCGGAIAQADSLACGIGCAGDSTSPGEGRACKVRRPCFAAGSTGGRHSGGRGVAPECARAGGRCPRALSAGVGGNCARDSSAIDH